VTERVVKGYMETLTEDVSWFCKKFDYRYDKEPWKNSKDSVERAIKFLRSDLHRNDQK
jgi:esterase/lipase superfamily enzyme